MAFNARGQFSQVATMPPNMMEAEHVRRVIAKTSGPTGMDVTQRYDPFGNNTFSSADNAWAAFFGTPAHPWKTTSYDKYDRHNWNLPEAYQGQNKRLAQTLDELIYSDETYYTSVLLPYNFTDQMGIEWDKWEFNEHFTGIVPEQGVSRLVSSKRETQSESFVRRGLAAIFEHGFMSTPQGRANYFLTLAQIARAVQETTNFGVIYAYLTCQNYRKHWEEKHGYFRRQTLKELLDRENFMWAIAIKEEFGLEKADAMITEWMNDYRASADTWILPPRVAIYLRLVPPEKTHYYLAGQAGPDRVNEIVGAGRPHEANAPNKRIQDIVEPYALFQKNQVFLTRTYHVDKTGPIDLMTRVSTVGEYFKIVPPSASCDYRNKGWQTCYSDTRIFDEDNNCGHTIKKADGLRYCQVFDPESGKPRQMSDNIAPPDARDLDQVFFMRRIIDPASQQEKYVPIEFTGDIDPQYFRPQDAVNVAYSAIFQAYPEKSDRLSLERTIEQGMRIIRQLSMEPLTAAAFNADFVANPLTADESFARIAGWTSWEAVNSLANAPITPRNIGPVLADFVSAVQRVATAIGPMLGGQDNLFLNGQNGIPITGYGEATPARVLYENALNYRSVPVFILNDGVDAPAAETPGLLNALVFLKKAILDQTDPAQAAIGQARGLTAADWAQIGVLRATIDNVPTMQTYESTKRDLLLRPEFSTARRAGTNEVNIGALKGYIAQLDAALADAARKNVREGSTVLRTGTATLRAVSENNPSVRDGSARAAGFALASRFDITRARDEYETRDASGTAVETIGMRLDDIPFMRGLSNAQESAVARGSVGSDYATARSAGHQSQSFGRDVPLEEYYDQEPVGRLFPTEYSAEAAETARMWIPSAGAGIGSETFNIRFGTFGYNIEQLSRVGASELAKLVALMYYGVPWNAVALDNMLENNLPTPFNILGFRVGMYDMALGIKCKAGGDTGYTYFGHSDFMLADDAAIKIHYGNYTQYGKSVIHRPENVFIAYDIFPNRALGGMGVAPYVSIDQFRPQDQVLLADIFYIMVPYTETQFPTVMSMAGRFYSYMDSGMLDGDDPANQMLHYSTAPYYNRFWGWYSDQVVNVELDEPMYRINNPGIQTNVWQGAQGNYNHMTEKFDRDIIRNRSPWGVTAEGCRDVRNGKMAKMPVVPFGQLGF